MKVIIFSIFIFLGPFVYADVPSSCNEKVRHIQDSVKVYFETIKINPENSQALQNIREQIFNSLRDEKGKFCFESLAQTYALQSLLYLTQEKESKKQNLFQIARIVNNLGIFEFGANELTQMNFSSKKILGTYDCINTKIYIDPYQSPFNLAATLIHEMSHLFIDKKFDKGLYKGPWGFTSRPDVKSLVLYDEALAVIDAGFIQRDFAQKTFINGMSTEVSDDLNLYAKDGLLVHSWSAYKNSYSDYPDWSYSLFFLLLFRNDIFDNYTNGILNQVSLTYFGSNLDKSALRQVVSIPNNHDHYQDHNYLLEEATGVNALDFIDMVPGLPPTPTCLRFQDALKNGKLDNYIGKFSKKKFGSEGAHPEQSGIRPCVQIGDKF